MMIKLLDVMKPEIVVVIIGLFVARSKVQPNKRCGIRYRLLSQSRSLLLVYVILHIYFASDSHLQAIFTIIFHIKTCANIETERGTAEHKTDVDGVGGVLFDSFHDLYGIFVLNVS